MSEAIGNGLGTVEHVLEATPATLESLTAEVRAFRGKVEPSMDRMNLALDRFEAMMDAIAESPMGKMMIKKMSKGDDA